MKKNPKTIRIVLVALLSAFTLTNCQKTPDNDSTPVSLDFSMNYSSDDTNGSSPVSEPIERIDGNMEYLFKDTIDLDNVVISVDVKVLIPKVMDFYIKTVEPDPFTKTQIETMIDTLYPPVDLYLADESTNIRTKKEIEKIILSYKEDIAFTREDTSLTTEERNGLIQVFEQIIDEWEIRYQDAPEENILPQIILDETNFTNSGSFILRKKEDGQAIGSLLLGSSTYENGKGSSVNFSFSPSPMENIDDSILIAQDKLKLLGVQDAFFLDTIIQSDSEENPIHDLYFVRSYNGLPENFVPLSLTHQIEEESYSFLWNSEYIRVKLTLRYVSLEWRQPTKVVATSDRLSELMDFSIIQNNALKQLKSQEAWISNSVYSVK